MNFADFEPSPFDSTRISASTPKAIFGALRFMFADSELDYLPRLHTTPIGLHDEGIMVLPSQVSVSQLALSTSGAEHAVVLGLSDGSVHALAHITSATDWSRLAHFLNDKIERGCIMIGDGVKVALFIGKHASELERGIAKWVLKECRLLERAKIAEGVSDHEVLGALGSGFFRERVPVSGVH